MFCPVPWFNSDPSDVYKEKVDDPYSPQEYLAVKEKENVDNSETDEDADDDEDITVRSPPAKTATTEVPETPQTVAETPATPEETDPSDDNDNDDTPANANANAPEVEPEDEPLSPAKPQKLDFDDSKTIGKDSPRLISPFQFFLLAVLVAIVARLTAPKAAPQLPSPVEDVVVVEDRIDGIKKYEEDILDLDAAEEVMEEKVGHEMASTEEAAKTIDEQPAEAEEEAVQEIEERAEVEEEAMREVVEAVN